MNRSLKRRLISLLLVVSLMVPSYIFNSNTASATIVDSGSINGGGSYSGTTSNYVANTMYGYRVYAIRTEETDDSTKKKRKYEINGTRKNLITYSNDKYTIDNVSGASGKGSGVLSKSKQKVGHIYYSPKLAKKIGKTDYITTDLKKLNNPSDTIDGKVIKNGQRSPKEIRKDVSDWLSNLTDYVNDEMGDIHKYDSKGTMCNLLKTLTGDKDLTYTYANKKSFSTNKSNGKFIGNYIVVVEPVVYLENNNGDGIFMSFVDYKRGDSGARKGCDTDTVAISMANEQGKSFVIGLGCFGMRKYKIGGDLSNSYTGGSPNATTGFALYHNDNRVIKGIKDTPTPEPPTPTPVITPTPTPLPTLPPSEYSINANIYTTMVYDGDTGYTDSSSLKVEGNVDSACTTKSYFYKTDEWGNEYYNAAEGINGFGTHVGTNSIYVKKDGTTVDYTNGKYPNKFTNGFDLSNYKTSDYNVFLDYGTIARITGDYSKGYLQNAINTTLKDATIEWNLERVGDNGSNSNNLNNLNYGKVISSAYVKLSSGNEKRSGSFYSGTDNSTSYNDEWNKNLLLRDFIDENSCRGLSIATAEIYNNLNGFTRDTFFYNGLGNTKSMAYERGITPFTTRATTGVLGLLCSNTNLQSYDDELKNGINMINGTAICYPSVGGITIDTSKSNVSEAISDFINRGWSHLNSIDKDYGLNVYTNSNFDLKNYQLIPTFTSLVVKKEEISSSFYNINVKFNESCSGSGDVLFSCSHSYVPHVYNTCKTTSSVTNKDCKYICVVPKCELDIPEGDLIKVIEEKISSIRAMSGIRSLVPTIQSTLKDYKSVINESTGDNLGGKAINVGTYNLDNADDNCGYVVIMVNLDDNSTNLTKTDTLKAYELNSLSDNLFKDVKYYATTIKSIITNNKLKKYDKGTKYNFYVSPSNFSVVNTESLVLNSKLSNYVRSPYIQYSNASEPNGSYNIQDSSSGAIISSTYKETLMNLQGHVSRQSLTQTNGFNVKPSNTYNINYAYNITRKGFFNESVKLSSLYYGSSFPSNEAYKAISIGCNPNYGYGGFDVIGLSLATPKPTAGVDFYNKDYLDENRNKTTIFKFKGIDTVQNSHKTLYKLNIFNRFPLAMVETDSSKSRELYSKIKDVPIYSGASGNKLVSEFISESDVSTNAPDITRNTSYYFIDSQRYNKFAYFYKTASYYINEFKTVDDALKPFIIKYDSYGGVSSNAVTAIKLKLTNRIETFYTKDKGVGTTTRTGVTDIKQADVSGDYLSKINGYSFMDTTVLDSIILKYNPEVKMLGHWFKRNSTNDSLESDEGYHTMVTMGHTKRKSNSVALRFFTVGTGSESSENAFTGTLLSEGFASGSKAETLGNKVTNNESNAVIYAGSDVQLKVESNIKFNTYGYYLDVISKNEVTKGYDTTNNTFTNVPYNTLVKTASDFRSTWGNSDNSNTFLTDFKNFTSDKMASSVGIGVTLNTNRQQYAVDFVDNAGATWQNNDFDTSNCVADGVYSIRIKNGVPDDTYNGYVALINQIALDYKCTYDEAKTLFNNSGIVDTIKNSIVSSTSSDNKSQADATTKGYGLGNDDHWYDEEVNYLVLRRYKAEGVSFGDFLVQDKIDYNDVTVGGDVTDAMTIGAKAYFGVTLYFKNATAFGGVEPTYDGAGNITNGGSVIYDPMKRFTSGHLEAAKESGSIIFDNLKIKGSVFTIPNATTDDMNSF